MHPQLPISFCAFAMITKRIPASFAMVYRAGSADRHAQVHAEEIDDKMGKKRYPSLREITKLVGVSTSTVSRILSGKNVHLYSKETVQKVHKAAAKLHYASNHLVKGIHQGQTQTMGVLIPCYQDFYGLIAAGIHDGLIVKDYVPITLWSKVDSPTGVGRTELEKIHQLVQRRVKHALQSIHLQLSSDSSIHIASKLLSQKPRPTAILTYNDHFAKTIYVTAQKLGLSIPSDLSVISFRNLPVYSNMPPSLTTLKQHGHELGQMATRMLFSIMKQKTLPNNPLGELLTPTLIKKESEGKAPVV